MQKLHYEVRRIGLNEFMNGDDVRVLEGSGGTSFTVKAVPRLRIPQTVTGQDFDRNVTVQNRIGPTIQHAHAAATEAVYNLIATDPIGMHDRNSNPRCLG